MYIDSKKYEQEWKEGKLIAESGNTLVYGAEKEYSSSKHIDEVLLENANRLGVEVIPGKIITSDVFDVYVDKDKFASNFPNYEDFLATEMEAFGLFYLAHKLKREAACLITVVDSKYDKKALSSDDRQMTLNDMILVALESIL